MTLDDYLHQRRESVAAFSRRTGLVRETLLAIRDGRTRCRIDIAQVIVRASEDEPAPDGGTVTYDDLVPQPDEGEAA